MRNVALTHCYLFLALISLFCSSNAIASPQDSYALQFNAPAYLQSPYDNTNPVFTDTSGFTIEAWIKPDSVLSGTSGGIITGYVSPQFSDGFYWSLMHGEPGEQPVDSTRWSFIDGSTPVSAPTGSLKHGQWHHIAVVYDVSSTPAIHLYQDGVLVNTTVKTISAVKFDFGSLVVGTNSFAYNGKIDDLRIWNQARSALDIQTNYRRELNGNEAGLTAYWKMNERTGQWVVDRSAHGHNLSFGGDPDAANAWDPLWITTNCPLDNDSDGLYNFADNCPADGTGKSWSDIGFVTSQARHKATAKLHDGKIIVHGGTYKTATGGDATIAGLTVLSEDGTQWNPPGFGIAFCHDYSVLHAATTLRDGRVLLTGGWNGSTSLATATLYDPATNTCSQAGAGGVMNQVRSQHTATLLNDGKVLVTGGWGAGGPTNTTEIYDPGTNTFANGPILSVPRNTHTATKLPDGSVIIAGGFSTSGTTKSVEKYDPGGPGFPVMADMLGDRGAHTATLLQDGRILLVGGQSTTGGMLTSVEIYNPAGTGTSVVSTPLNVARAWHSAVQDLGGDVTIIGGNTASGFWGDTSAFTATTEYIDMPAGNVFNLGNLNLPRSAMSAALLDDGRLVAIGGLVGTETGAKTEVYGPLQVDFDGDGAGDVCDSYAATANPDLTGVIAGASTACIGATLAASTTNTIFNDGAQDAGPFEISYRLSTDPVINFSDPELQQPVTPLSVPGLLSGQSLDITDSLILPSASVLAGDLYLGTVIDYLDDVSEFNELNNTPSMPIKILASTDPACLLALDFKNLLFSADFNSDTPGAFPSDIPPGPPPGDWAFNSRLSADGSSVQVDTGLANLTDNAVRLHRVENGTAEPIYIANPDPAFGPYDTGIYKVSWKWAALQASSVSGVMILNTSKGVALFAEFNDDDIKLNGEFPGPDTYPLVSANPGVAQQFDAIVNMDTMRVDLSVNGIPVLVDSPFSPNTQEIPLRLVIRVAQPATNEENYAIDDISISLLDDIDSDGDGIPNQDDNCPLDANLDQTDSNGDGVGDACDIDGDGVPDNEDAFPNDPNESADTDSDTIGDNTDNCPVDNNDLQEDLDGDLIGDACDDDDDNDGLLDVADACPEDSRNDLDLDGHCACDREEWGTCSRFDATVDPNHTNLVGANDNCPFTENPGQENSDGDTLGDACDAVFGEEELAPPNKKSNTPADTDGDGVEDTLDSCPNDTNVGDTDGDGVDDACDVCRNDPENDADSDLHCANPGDLPAPEFSSPMLGGDDNCPDVSNSDQADNDIDGVGNVCDTGDPGTDFDEDGFGSEFFGGTDCNDADDTINPAATELYRDGFDNDCDPATLDSDYAIVFTPSVDLNTWLPDPDISPTVTISAHVVDGTNTPLTTNVTPVAFETMEVSAYCGAYTNDESEDCAAPAVDAVLVDNGDGTATLTVSDFAAYIKIRGTATVTDGDGNPVAVSSETAGDFVMPRDSDGDFLPDPYETAVGRDIGGADEDNDAFAGSALSGLYGDDLTAHMEFRGFKFGPELQLDCGFAETSCPDTWNGSPTTNTGVYNTHALVPTGATGHFRTSPDRQDVFTVYSGYDVTPNNVPFSLGTALHNAGVEVHVVDAVNDIFGSANIQPVSLVLDFENTYGCLAQFSICLGDIDKRGVRDWNPSTLGATTPTTAETYGSSKVFWKPMTNWWNQKPYHDEGGSFGADGDGILQPLALVEDLNDDGYISGKGKSNEDVDGDGFLDLDKYKFSVDGGQFTTFDMNLDGNVELPVVGASADVDLNLQYGIFQGVKHVGTHEFIHALGASHNTSVVGIMNGTTNNLVRDGHIDAAALRQIDIRN